MKTKIKPATASVAPTLYKVLTADGHSPYITAYAWSLPTQNADGSWTPGAWHEEPASVFDLGHGLHITPAPDHYWPRNTCVAYECEASGYREDPLTDHHVVALRVRLLRPVSMEEAREAATKARANEAARAAAGVESPALTAFRLLVELTPTESWRDVNSCRFDALAYATEYLRFDPSDVKTIYNEFRGSYWFGCGSGADERLYERAVKKGNVSACVAWEKFFGRKPWIGDTSEGKRERLAVDIKIRWEGVWCFITSMSDEKLIACTYKKGTGYERKIDRRFTITREAFKQASAKKSKAERKAA